jgi:hypothetical protein
MASAKKTGAQAYQLKVTLDGIAPPIWRRLLVTSDISLEKLHEVLQVAMGWTNSHLHQFTAGKTCYGMPDVESPAAMEDERDYALSQVAKTKGSKFTYEYDFGDFWEHVIVVEDVRPSDGKTVHPQCLGGARSCPPEDVGSTSGYEHFLEAIRDPKHPEHDELLEWAGGHFDPEAFSVDEANKELEDWRKHGLPMADKEECI